MLFFLSAVLGALVAPAISGLGGSSVNASAAANDILTHESSVRLGFALGLISTVCYVALQALFYQVFRPVSKNVALLAAFFGLVGSAVTALGALFQLAPLVVLRGNSSGFSRQQLQELALMFLNLNVQTGYIALVFFGFFQLMLGYLIFRSTFLPRVLGVVIAVAGLGWLLFLAPPVANQFLAELEVLGFVAEAALMLWLLVIGVDADRWAVRAAAA